MEEINLELEKDNHKSINFSDSNSRPSLSNVNIIKESKSSAASDIGLDLLVNKSKIGNESPKPIEEFKPSDPIINSSNNTSSINHGIEKEIDLNDIGITDVPLNSVNMNSTNMNSTNMNNTNMNSTNMNNLDNISSTIDLNSNNDLKDLDLNLDNLLNDTKSSQNQPPTPTREPTPAPTPIHVQQKSYEEIQKEKAEFIRLLERMEKRGLQPHKRFTMDSDYNEVKTEFERLSRQRECDQSVQFQRKMLVAFITAIEFLNNKFDPIDLKLDGWSESIHENIVDYDDVFEELHEKYKGTSQMAPELKLLLMVGGSGFMFHLTNTMFKSSLPGMGDVMRQNPDLMKQFASAAANTMASSGGEGAGFGNLMGDLFSGGGGGGGPSPPRPPSQPRREMNGPPDISDILNNMSNNKNVNVDFNSGFSESEVETANGTKKTRTLDLNI